MAPVSRMFLPALLFIATLGIFATDIYLPSFPAITSYFHSPKAAVKLSLSLYFLSFSLSQLIYGPVSDRYGRKKVMFSGISFSLVGTLLCLFAPNITLLITGRFLQGMGLGSVAIFRSVFSDAYKGEELSLKSSYVAMTTSTFMALAPAFGGYLQSFFGWRSTFAFLFIYTVVALIVLYYWLPETHKDLNPHALRIRVLFGNYFHLIKSPIFLGYTGCTTLVFGGLSAYLTASPFLFQDILHLSPVQYGWLAVFVALGLALGGISNRLFVKKFGRHTLLRRATYLMIFSGLLMLIPALFGVMNIWIIMIPMVFYMTGGGIAFVNSFAGAIHPFSKIGGTTGALYGCFQMLGAMIASAIMASIVEVTQIPLALFLLSAGILTYLLQRLGHHHTVKKGLG